jgi:hypothetical protein
MSELSALLVLLGITCVGVALSRIAVWIIRHSLSDIDMDLNINEDEEDT